MPFATVRLCLACPGILAIVFQLVAIAIAIAIVILVVVVVVVVVVLLALCLADCLRPMRTSLTPLAGPGSLNTLCDACACSTPL